MKSKILTILFASTVMGGCTLAPDYVRPDLSSAAVWSNVPGYELPAGENIATQLHWKTFFQSPELANVIELALANNKDLRTSALNIEEARALYRVSRADLMPNVNASGDATITKNTDETSATGSAVKSEVYEANIGVASYELDLFGKIRSNNESDLNEYLATQEAYAVVRNSLIAETANAYLQLLADQKLLALTEKTLEAQNQTYDILKQSLEKGVATEQDVARAQTAVETARVNMHLYKRLVAQDKNALFLLMGLPQDNSMLPNTTLDDIVLADNLSPGLPSDVLLARPDVRQAEYELLARNADIGAARAAFFPSITLTGSAGFASQSLGNLFASGAGGAWAFLPQITLPIFQGGRNQANLDLAEIRKEKAIVNYEWAVQSAFRDVADELAARATLDEQLQSQRRLVAAAQKVYDISQARYKSGIDSFLSVLDSQRELYTYQQNEIQIEQQRLSNLVSLYRALGGGTIVKP